MRLVRKLAPFGFALLLLLGASCTSDSPTAPSIPSSEQQPSAEFGLLGGTSDGLLGGLTDGLGDLTGTVLGTVGSVTDLLLCSPQPYDQESEYIGPNGGVLRVGTHWLVVPSGALSRTVKITGEQVPGRTNSVRFSPEGLRFEKPAMLTMGYGNCALVLVQKRIVYTDENLTVLEVLRSLDLFRSKTVSAPIDHFSRYAVAY